MLYEKKFLRVAKLYEKKIFDLKLKNIRVNQSGCLDKCESGPVMVIILKVYGITIKIN